MIKFDVARLNQIIADNNKKNDTGNNKEYTKIAYLPQGKHTMRFFIDPDQNITRELAIHQTKGKKCLCPDHLNKKNRNNPKWPEIVQAMKPEYKEQNLQKLPDCEICKIAKEINDWRSGLSLKYNHVVYASLYETNAASDYWVPNKEQGVPYALIGKGKMKNALMSTLESLAAGAPEFIVKMLNPTMPAAVAVVDVIGGNQGSVSINVMPIGDKPPVINPADEKMPEWYRPLSQIFIPEDFDVLSYEEFVAYAKEKQAELQANPLEPENDTGSTVTSTDSQNILPGGNISLGSATSPNVSSPEATVAAQQMTQPAGEKLVVDQVAQVSVPSDPVAASNDLAPNERMTKMGRKITLPTNVIEMGCWKEFNTSTPKCMTCPINLECMTEKGAA